MLCARIYICIQTYFMQIVKKHAFFCFYMSSYKKKLIFFLSVCTCGFFSTPFLGQGPYTHQVQMHAVLALLFAFYSWLDWQVRCHPDVCVRILRRCNPPAFLAYSCRGPRLCNSSSHSVALPGWHQSGVRGRNGPTSFDWNNKSSASKALWHMQRWGGMGEDWSGKGQRSVQGSNGGCGVWPRVAIRLMNGSSGEFKRVGRQGEPVLIHDDYILIIFFLLCFFLF